MILKGLEDLEIGGWVETIQTTALLKTAEKSPGDLRRLAVTQTPVKDHQLTLMWTTLISNNNNNNNNNNNDLQNSRLCCPGWPTE